MDLVLGLSMASDAVRWVLVEGTTGEGAPVDRGVSVELGDLLDGVAADRLHAVGVSWTPAAGDAATAVLQALADRGIDNVVVVSDVEAAEALAGGIAELSGYDELAVCIVEPEVVLVALCGPDGVTVERVADGSAAVALPGLDEREAIFVVGSGDHEPVTVALADSPAPVITATEAEFALARGVALASARAVNGLEKQAVRSHLRTLTSVLAAAVVTFVVSLSVAIGLQLTPDPDPGQRQVSTTGDQSAQVAEKPSAPKLAPPAPRPAAPPAPKPAAPPKVAETIAVAVPPAPVVVPVAPVYEPPAPAYVPPAPVYVPPAPPAYVPPAQTPYVPPAQVPQPRLRDRIIERIPIINRFHEPEYQYPGQ